MTSRSTVLAVVCFLGVFTLGALGAVTWLVHDHISADAVAVIATPMGVALGALASILASTRSSPDQPANVPQVPTPMDYGTPK